MRKSIAALVAVFALLAGACNGHGDVANDQIVEFHDNGISGYGENARHNHEANNDIASYAFARLWFFSPLGYPVQVCIQYAEVRDADEQVIHQGEVCETHDPPSGQINDPHYADAYYWGQEPEATHTVNAVESRFAIWNDNGGGWIWIEYHDPDGSNPTWAPGIPA